MDLLQKIRSIPPIPACISTRTPRAKLSTWERRRTCASRVASYFHEGRWEDSKTGTLVREAVDVDYIVVANNKEALALENNLIKQRKPRFNILLRDDKTYPYVKLTLGERWPRVYVTRRLRKDGSAYYGPYFPANLAYRIVDLIHRTFLIPSCKVDLTRFHPRPCLQYYIKRCLGPCVQDLTSPEAYQEAVRDVKLFLEGRPTDLSKSLSQRMEQAAAAEEYERAARYRDLISTVEQLQERQRIAAAEGDDADVFGYHYENGMLAVNLFHMRGGRVVDRREFFWEDLPEITTEPMRTEIEHEGTHIDHVGDGHFCASRRAKLAGLSRHGRLQSRRILLCSLEATLHRPALRSAKSLRPSRFRRSRSVGRSTLRASRGRRRPRRACSYPRSAARDKRALIDLAGTNAKQSYDQRFRVLKPNARKIQEETAGSGRPARITQAHRVLRHLAHSGRGDRSLDGGMEDGKMKEIRLSQVHHPHGRGRRRFCVDARGGHAPLQAPSAGRKADAKPGADRWRTRTVARCCRSAGVA